MDLYSDAITNSIVWISLFFPVIGSDNITPESCRLSGIQHPEEYKQNFDVSSEGLSSGSEEAEEEEEEKEEEEEEGPSANARNVDVLLVFFT